MDIGNLNQEIDLNPGEWIDDIPTLPGARLRVRSTNFKFYKNAIDGLVRRMGKKMNTDGGVGRFRVATGKHLAEHILLGWDLSEAEDAAALTSNGEPLPYSAENALLVLSADDPHGVGQAFRDGVEWAGDRVAERVRERSKEAAGN